MRLYGAISKIEPLNDGTVRVHGIASSEAVDDQGEVVQASAIRAQRCRDTCDFLLCVRCTSFRLPAPRLRPRVDADGMTRDRRPCCRSNRSLQG